MATATFILGESVRRIDDRYRLTLPPKLAESILAEQDVTCKLAKERLGALSLWKQETWQERVEPGIAVVEQKVRGGWMPAQVAEVQQFARLLSTRSGDVTVSAAGRLVIPEEFREFLGVKVPGDCVVVGAGLCIEIWNPESWHEYLKQETGTFGALFEKLSK